MSWHAIRKKFLLIAAHLMITRDFSDVYEPSVIPSAFTIRGNTVDEKDKWQYGTTYQKSGIISVYSGMYKGVL